MRQQRKLYAVRIKGYAVMAGAVLLLSALACGGGSSSNSGGHTSSRSFAMGFTPWPYDDSVMAVENTYDKAQAHGDLIAHHIDGGVPWPEAFADTDYPAAVENELQWRLDHTDTGKLIYLSVCPLNTSRDAPADYWGADTNMPRPAPWDGYTFGDPELVTAYTRHMINLIERFQPDYCNYGIEVTEYLINQPAQAAALFGFLQQVYDSLKLAYPDLPLFISAALKSPQSAEAGILRGYAAQISNCTDIIGASTYGYVFYGHADSGDPANLPSDWLSQVQDLAPGKPVAVAETGWLAEDMIIPFYGLNVPGTLQWQDEYVQVLLDEADRLDARFVTWFCVVDFDTLWLNRLGQDPLAQIWRDIGLYDETLQPRPALSRWNEWLDRSLR